MDATNPLSAVTIDNPETFYRMLASERPVYRDEHLAAWVVSGNDAVSAILTDTSMHVRPANEPVPKAMIGTSIGHVFERLVRFTDDETGAVIETALRSSLASIDREVVTEAVSRAFRILSDHCESIDDIIDDGSILPAITPFVTAALLGFADDRCERIARLARPIAKALGPGADATTIANAIPATDELRELVDVLIEGPCGTDFAHGFVAEARAAGVDRQAVIANVIGLFFQGYDANAGLIGIALEEIARSEADLEKARTDRDFLPSYVRAVAHRLPAIHNTRRFASTDRLVLGRAVRAGDGLLVLLASGTVDRDSPMREVEVGSEDAIVESLAFGLGRHRCPGSALAVDIASAVVRSLIDRGFTPNRLVLDGYEPSLNARIPRLSVSKRSDCVDAIAAPRSRA